MICPHGHDEGMVERRATPEEVDAGCELGIAFDPCPDCVAPKGILVVDEVQAWTSERRERVWDTLLGVPDYDHQAETGQGPPA